MMIHNETEFLRGRRDALDNVCPQMQTPDYLAGYQHGVQLLEKKAARHGYPSHP